MAARRASPGAGRAGKWQWGLTAGSVPSLCAARLDQVFAIVFTRPACGLLLALASQAASPDALRTCTLIGCADGVHFAVHGLPDELPTGVYRASAAVDGAEVSCEAPTLAPGAPVFCSAGAAAAGIQLELGEHHRSVRVVGSTPRHVRLELRRDGRVLGAYEGDPGPYRVFHPNGPGCPSVCLQAGPIPLPVE